MHSHIVASALTHFTISPPLRKLCLYLLFVSRITQTTRPIFT